MSNPISSSTSSTIPPPAETLPIPTFLETAGKTTKIIFGVLAGIAAIGSFGIGVTFTPFAPKMGAAALALATALFGVSGFLIYSDVSPSLMPKQLEKLVFDRVGSHCF